MAGENVEVKIQNPESGVHAPVVETKASDRPAWLPEKFKTAEDMAKSYVEAEKKITELTQGKKTTEPEKPVPKAADGKPQIPPSLEKADQEALTKAGLDLAALEEEYLTNGNKLSEASLKKLSDAGIDQSKMETYQRGRLAQVEDFEKVVTKDLKGGRLALDAATEWAAKNLTPPEIESFNKVMMSSDANSAALAAEGLVARHSRSLGPNLIEGTRSSDSADVYESRAQMLAAMKDSRYKNDPAYRDSVMAKSLRSDPKH